eukprot:403364806
MALLYKLSKYTIGAAVIDQCILSPQLREDLRAVFKGTTNTFKAGPIVGYSVYDYIKNLRGVPYPSEEYIKIREEVNTRVAKRLLYLSTSSGGIYLKAGQYIGTLERIAPKEYIEVLKVLQDKGPALPYEKIKIVYENDMGCKIEDVFSEFDREAIAAASIAQVHRAKLKDTGEIVAVKLQFPRLRVQTRLDMFVIRKLIGFANWMCKYYDYQGMDFQKFNQHFQQSIVKELDFMQEVVNAERTRNNFKKYNDLYIPKNNIPLSSRRAIVMEYVEGLKINDLEGLKQQFGDPQKATSILIDVFAKMIFLYGHVHCDAHPGNIYVRQHPDKPAGNPQIVLLDHGFYCDIDDKFRMDFCKLWYSMVTMDYQQVKKISTRLGIGEYFRYLPLLFTYRTINAKKPLGATVAKEEIEFLKGNDEVNFEKISFLMQQLPSEIVFIFKAMHIIGVHNARSGGQTRKRLLLFTQDAITALSYRHSIFYRFWLNLKFWIKLIIFEKAFWLYQRIWGFMEIQFDEKNKAIVN